MPRREETANSTSALTRGKTIGRTLKVESYSVLREAVFVTGMKNDEEEAVSLPPNTDSQRYNQLITVCQGRKGFRRSLFHQPTVQHPLPLAVLSSPSLCLGVAVTIDTNVAIVVASSLTATCLTNRPRGPPLLSSIAWVFGAGVIGEKPWRSPLMQIPLSSCLVFFSYIISRVDRTMAGLTSVAFSLLHSIRLSRPS